MATPKLLHLRSAVQGKLPPTGSIQVGQIGVNYHASDPFLCIKDTTGAVRRLGGPAIGAVAPTLPGAGQLWLDTTLPLAPVLKAWTGTSWVVPGAPTPPVVRLISGNGVVPSSAQEIQTIDQGVI
jgi:hypothetical protein